MKFPMICIKAFRSEKPDRNMAAVQDSQNPLLQSGRLYADTFCSLSDFSSTIRIFTPYTFKSPLDTPWHRRHGSKLFVYIRNTYIRILF